VLPEEEEQEGKEAPLNASESIDRFKKQISLDSLPY